LRTPAAATVTALASVALGVGVGLLSLLIYYNVRNVAAVANPLEHMLLFAAESSALLQQTQALSTALLATLATGVGRALAVHTFVFSPSGRPTLLLRHRARRSSAASGGRRSSL